MVAQYWTSIRSSVTIGFPLSALNVLYSESLKMSTLTKVKWITYSKFPLAILLKCLTRLIELH